jgi:uncharacterized protein with PQ loop repeat
MNINEIYGLVFTILFNVAPLFQLVKILRNKSSYNNSMGMWICSGIGQVCVLMYYYSMRIGGIFNYINCIIGLTLNVVMVACIYYYGRYNNNDRDINETND